MLETMQDRIVKRMHKIYSENLADINIICETKKLSIAKQVPPLSDLIFSINDSLSNKHTHKVSNRTFDKSIFITMQEIGEGIGEHKDYIMENISKTNTSRKEQSL